MQFRYSGYLNAILNIQIIISKEIYNIKIISKALSYTNDQVIINTTATYRYSLYVQKNI